MIATLALSLLVQDHAHHAPPPAEPTEQEAQPMDHGAMDHGSSDIPKAPPPPEAGSGPPRAADAIWGREAMEKARAQLRDDHGDMTTLYVQADRLEARIGEGADGYLWDAQGYYGGDIDKLWVESEGEGNWGERPESADLEVTWSRAISPWWDLQTGLRQDLAGPERTYATIGIQGLAPYMFEVDAAAYLSTKGDITFEIEAELDQYVTQRLILQPRGELLFSLQDVPELGLGGGLSKVEAGLRLRYELAREFAPYVGISREWALGQAADFARADGERTGATRFVVGIRAWY